MLVHRADETDRGVAAAIGGDVVALRDERGVVAGARDAADFGPGRAAVAAGLHRDVFAGLEAEAQNT